MPNGDPEWPQTELPKLEQFFAPLSDEIRRFATAHNMAIEKYYHESPDWSLQFTPPQGGNATIDIRRVDEQTFMLYQIWFIDDYDAATRFSRWGNSPEYRVGEVSLTDVLNAALREMLAWPVGHWSQISKGYENAWHQFTREQFENMN